jgi:hypothetical protein
VDLFIGGDCDLYGHHGLVLLSIVAQDLLLYISYVLVRIFLFLVMSMRATSERSRLMRARICTGTHHKLRMAEEGILF